MTRLLEWAARLLPSVGLALLLASFLLVPGVASADDPGGGPDSIVNCKSYCAVGCLSTGQCGTSNACTGTTCTCNATGCGDACYCKVITNGCECANK